MVDNEEAILAVAEIVRDSAAMNDAALGGDFDEARFRAKLIVGKADAAGYLDLVLTAAHLLPVTAGGYSSNAPRSST